MVTANNYMFRRLTNHRQVVHVLKRGFHYMYEVQSKINAKNFSKIFNCIKSSITPKIFFYIVSF
jgi:spore cortex formation protein SpoVR/YcgB (stage V sporulation)